MQSGNDVCEHPKSRGDSLDEQSKRTCTRADPETAKRPRCENWSLGSLVFECLLSSSRIGFFFSLNLLQFKYFWGFFKETCIVCFLFKTLFPKQ